MKITFISVMVTALLLIIVGAGYAETRYVSDQLVVTVRSSKSKNHDILATLPTATPVEILSEDASFVKVRTEKGIEGFITRQYVSKEIPKSIQIAKLKEQKSALEKQLQKQKLNYQQTSELATTSQSEIKQLRDELQQTKQQLESVSSAYKQLRERSENVVNLTAERDQLREDNSQILNELTVLQEENKDFHRSNMIQWFLAGGGVFLTGWLIGKISRKKHGYSRI